MTKEQIQSLIADKIAGQGNQVDAGGALAGVLNEILDMVAGVAEDTPRPIVLKGNPAEGDIYEDIIGLGLTPQEIKEAKNGKRTNVITPLGSFFITKARYTSDDICSIAFYDIEYDSDGLINEMTGWNVIFENGNVSVVQSNV